MKESGRVLNKAAFGFYQPLSLISFPAVCHVASRRSKKTLHKIARRQHDFHFCRRTFLTASEMSAGFNPAFLACFRASETNPSNSVIASGAIALRMITSFFLISTQYLQYVPFQRRDIFPDRIPNSFEVNAEIIMDQNVPKPNGLFPLHKRILAPHSFRHIPCCFSDDLEIP